MTYEQIKDFIKNSIRHCDELNGCNVVEAFSNRVADNPVKGTICAIGLMEAEDEAVQKYSKTVEVLSDISVFIDIYSPAALGGEHSRALALALIDKLRFDYYSIYSLNKRVLAAEYLSSCRAFKSRIIIKSSALPEEKSSLSLGDAYNALFNGLSYLCRKTRCELSPFNTAVQCYGEAVPCAYYPAGERAVLEVERFVTDDGKTLCDLKYPFRFEDLSDRGFILEDCAIVEYAVDDGVYERVKIIGRRVSE